MTSLLDSDAAVAEVPPRRRRIWPRALAAVVVLALIGTGIAAVVYAHTYQPLGNAGFSLTGPVTEHTLKRIGDGNQDTQFVIVGPRGTTATAMYTFGNNGRFAVRILGLSRPTAFDITGVKWAPFEGPATDTENYEPGLLSEGRNFPITLQPHDAVLLQVTVEQPVCGPSAASAQIVGVPLRWSALGVHHVWTFPLQLEGDNLPILTCPSKAALAHIDRF